LIKIGYFADGPWAHYALRKLIEDPDITISFVVPRKVTTDNTLKDIAVSAGIDYLTNVNVNSVKFFKRATKYNCDLFVSMSYDQIFRKKIFELPPLKTINCHAGKLPFYRGRNVLNWAIINDEKEFGITVHYVDEGIDTGDIILQEEHPITDDDNYDSVLRKAYVGCSKILYKAIKLIEQGKGLPKRQKYIHPTGTYCGRRGEGDEIINWNSNSRVIFNFIRALSIPGPKATTTNQGNLVKINRCKLVQNAPNYINTCGQVLAKTEFGFYIKTGDSFLEISEIESELPLRVGDKLGS